jgi:septum site-determining protein MinD
MTGKTIAIHSCRGGTGKSIIAANLAVILARKGLNIALLDLDFRAPSLAIVFSKDDKGLVKWWLNDFLNGKCVADQVVIDVSGKYNLKTKLLIGLANPSIEAIRGMTDKSSSWEVTAVKRIFSLLSSLFKEMKIDLCIVDTSPGVQYSSINAVVSSDLSIVVTTLDSLDLKCTRNLLLDLYDPLERKSVVLVNKYSPETRLSKDKNPRDIISRVEESLKHKVIGIIPCFCDVLERERTAIMAVKDPEHQFVRNLGEIADNLRKMEQIC